MKKKTMRRKRKESRKEETKQKARTANYLDVINRTSTSN